jgi:energy-coupling factor transporter transmembrane protein EcfT
LHPGTRIILYVYSALVVPGLNFFQLGILNGILILASVKRWGALYRLLKRARWLLLLMILTYAYHLPGDVVWHALGDWSPTRQGLHAGVMQSWRLATMLLLLDVQILRLPVEGLLTGIYALLRPFAPLGLDPRRAALRLALTMEAMEQPGGLKVFRAILEGRHPEDTLPREYALSIRPFRMLDWCSILLGLIGLILWFSA